MSERLGGWVRGERAGAAWRGKRPVLRPGERSQVTGRDEGVQTIAFRDLKDGELSVWRDAGLGWNFGCGVDFARSDENREEVDTRVRKTDPLGIRADWERGEFDSCRRMAMAKVTHSSVREEVDYCSDNLF